MTRLTDDDLKIARALEDWDKLWLAAEPLVKFAMSELRCGDEDALQEGRLAAGAAVRSWDPAKGAFSTHIANHARFAILNYFNQSSAGGVGSRAGSGPRRNRFVSLDSGDYESVPGPPRDHDSNSFLDRLTHADLDDSTAFEQLLRSGEMQNQADQLLRFIPEEDAVFFRGVTKAGGSRAFARAHGLASSTVRDRVRAIVNKLSAHYAKFSYTDNTQNDHGQDHNGRFYIMEAVGNPWADWAYKPTDEDVSRGAAPRDDAYNWSLGARGLIKRLRRGT